MGNQLLSNSWSRGIRPFTENGCGDKRPFSTQFNCQGETAVFPPSSLGSFYAVWLVGVVVMGGGETAVILSQLILAIYYTQIRMKPMVFCLTGAEKTIGFKLHGV